MANSWGGWTLFLFLFLCLSSIARFKHFNKPWNAMLALEGFGNFDLMNGLELFNNPMTASVAPVAGPSGEEMGGASQWQGPSDPPPAPSTSTRSAAIGVKRKSTSNDSKQTPLTYKKSRNAVKLRSKRI